MPRKLNESTPVTVPDFLTAGTAAAYLDIPYGNIPELKPYTHHLELPHRKEGTGNARFPVPYIVPLKSFMMGSSSGVARAAELFSRTPTARMAILAAENTLDAKFTAADRGEDLFARDVMNLVDVGRKTISDWREQEFAEIYADDTSRLRISVEGLKHALTWVRPDAYNPLLRPLDEPLNPGELHLRPVVTPHED